MAKGQREQGVAEQEPPEPVLGRIVARLDRLHGRWHQLRRVTLREQQVDVRQVETAQRRRTGAAHAHRVLHDDGDVVVEPPSGAANDAVGRHSLRAGGDRGAAAGLGEAGAWLAFWLGARFVVQLAMI